jgi:hypothetical protein
MANTRTATLIRDEFEQWLDDHRDEVMDHLDQRPRSLGNWIMAFSKAMAATAEEHGHEDDEGIDGAFGNEEGDVPSIFGDLDEG